MNPSIKLQWPVLPIRINQIFGVNGDYYKSHGINIDGHNGLDLGITHGQEIRAAHDGMAYFEVDAQGGHGIVNVSPLNFKTIYWHMTDNVKEPQYKYAIPTDGTGYAVKEGQLLGYGDNTGLSTGDHLHFGLKLIAPGETPGVWGNVDQHNGYLGAIDPLPYLPFVYTFTKNLSVGSMGSDVLRLQKALVKVGFASFTPTGFFGAKTLEAVKVFQKIYGIPITGFVGPISRSQLSVLGWG